jgi:hypothetical protein
MRRQCSRALGEAQVEYVGEIISFVLGALAGGIGVKVYTDRSTRTTTTQSGNKVGGDMAGRDINKR